MALSFAWNPIKSRANKRKHGVGFEEAATVFRDPLSITVPDAKHSDYEERFVIAGRSSTGRILTVVHTEEEDYIRLISARLATKREVREYEKG